MPTGKPKKDNPAVYASSAPNKEASSMDHSNPSTHTQNQNQNQLNDFLGNKPGLGKEQDLDDQDLKGILAHRFLSALLDDVIMDTAFEAHKKETKKRRSACPVCNSSSCRSIASGSSSSTPQPQPQSQPSTSSQPSNNNPPSSAPENISSTSAESQATQPSQETAKSVAETIGSGNLPSTSDAASTSSHNISTSTDSLAVPNSASAPQSQTSTPALSTPPPNQPTTSTSAPSSTIKPTTNGTSNPVSTSSSNTTDYYSHNPLFECLVCSRQVSSNRYAPHLAKCLGLGSNSSSKTSSSRKSKGSDSSAAALAFSRGQKVASALENRKRAMGMSPSLGSGSSARNSPVPSLTNRGGTADSDDEPLKNSTDQSKKKTLGDSLGLSLNKYGKRALSPNFGVGKGNWKRNKNKTATPPPSSSVGASGSQDSSLDPNSSTGMVRSHSANTPLSSVSSSQPFSHSPLNPNKYNNSANGKEADSIKEGDNVSPSKAGNGDDASGSNENLNSGHLGGDEEMEDFGDSPGPLSGSGLLNNGKNRKKLGKEGYSDEDSSMLSNSNSFSSAEGTSASEADEPTSSEEESSDEGENDLDDESPSESSQPRGRVGATYGRNSKKKSNNGTAGAGAGVMLERSRGSDGEFIGVDSASEQEDDDDDF